MNKKKMGIQRKLMLFILPVVVIALAAVILIAYSNSKTSIEEKTLDLLETEGKYSASSILEWKSQNLVVLDTAVDTMLNLKQTDAEILHYGGFYLETYEEFPYGIYIAYEDGKVLDASGWEPDYDVTQSSWYAEGMNHEKFAFGEPYVDSMTGEYIVTASRKIPSLNGKEAVAAADVNLSILTDVIANMDVVGDGDAFIVDANTGIILAHKNPELVALEVSDLSDFYYTTVYNEILAQYSGAKSFDSAEGAYMTSIENIDGTSWYIVTRALENNIFSDLRLLGVALATFGIIVVGGISVLLIIMIGKITKPIEKLTNTIVAVTEGDFTAQIEISGNDEVTIMAESMSRFMEVMRETLGSIIQISDVIDAQAQDSNEISSELYDSASGQADAMTQMRENLEELVESISVIAENATKLATVVSNTNESGEAAMSNIEVTMQEAEGGRNSMRTVTDSMNGMKEEMGELEVSITNVGSAAVKIAEITTTIRGIAEETNLLALNASIEAARAGEAGKGFAVVATEIKKLAETSAEAADEISQLINSVTDLINNTVNQSHHSMEQINKSAELVYQASDQFNNIYESIENTSGIVNGMIREIREANDVATNMAAITEEQSASAEEIEATAVSVLEMTNMVRNNSGSVKEDAKELAETAESLKDNITKFRI